MENNPLVSIVIITYNSSKYVLETLESARTQSYQNIELIVTDDCSKDNTVEVCRDWIAQNRDRFVRVELIESPVNTGISANCNRGYGAAKGEWIKGIAGDDVLLDNCVMDNVNHVLKNSHIDILISNIQSFADDSKNIDDWGSYITTSFFDCPAREQFYKLICSSIFIPAPTLFVKRSLYELFLFDEDIPFIEDYPFWIRLTKSGRKLHYINIKTVKYRVMSGVSTSSNNILTASVKRMYWKYKFTNQILCNPLIAFENLLKKVVFIVDLRIKCMRKR